MPPAIAVNTINRASTASTGLPFLLEIGSEEIPDWMIPGALENLGALFEETLAKAGMRAQSASVDGTPRRLVLRAEGLLHESADAEFAERALGHIGRRFAHEIGSLGGLREGNHIADGRFAGEQHHQAVESERNPAVGRRAVFERVQ